MFSVEEKESSSAMATDAAATAAVNESSLAAFCLLVVTRPVPPMPMLEEELPYTFLFRAMTDCVVFEFVG